MRLIDAEPVEYALQAICDRESGVPLAIAEWIAGTICDAPAVDAVPVVHGRWEKCWQDKSKHYFRCSICHTAYMDGVSGAIGPEYGSRAWRYCPNCGAKMDGGDNS